MRNKLLVVLLMFSVLLFADGVGLEQKHYNVVDNFIDDLSEGLIYNQPTPYYEQIEVGGDIVDAIVFRMDEAYVDVVVQDRLFSDTVLREIVFQSVCRNVPIEAIVKMIFINVRADPTQEIIRLYAQWFYRIRAFGVPERRILDQLKTYPKDFLMEDKL